MGPRRGVSARVHRVSFSPADLDLRRARAYLPIRARTLPGRAIWAALSFAEGALISLDGPREKPLVRVRVCVCADYHYEPAGLWPR